MYIRLGQGNIDSSRLGDILGDLQTALAAASDRPGFRNAYVGVNRTNGRVVTISTWDTEEQASFAPSSDARARRQTLGLQPEPIMVLEVIDQV
ncbi:MAG: hypothetical protein JO352_00615 [Chloroflexi bacterium]|nr:hypothetical protein [Chloroflexota bacterium]MBV9595422.1 hypothetical protein [Chloroflexota bacterium]